MKFFKSLQPEIIIPNELSEKEQGYFRHYTDLLSPYAFSYLQGEIKKME